MSSIEKVEKEEFKPLIVAFCCNWCSYAGADLAGTSRLNYPANVKIIRVPCSCRVNTNFIIRAFQKGADGVDLTSYRYADGDPIELTKAVVEAIGADRVCIAGSVGNEERMNEMKESGVAEYTMGSALFNANFVKGGSFRENLEFVLDYLKK